MTSANFAERRARLRARIADRATYDRPHRYATGVETVLVNGTLVVDRGEHTGAKPGRALRGPGWKGR